MNAQIKIEDVMKVYSGKAHACHCGCTGKYYYAKAHQATASKSRGYEVTDDEVSDRMIKRVVNKVNAVLALTDERTQQQVWDLDVADDGQYISITEEDRRDYVVYFIPEKQADYRPEPVLPSSKVW